MPAIEGNTTRRVLVLFWVTVVFGFAVSPLIFIGTSVARGRAVASAAGEWTASLFKPGYNEYLVDLLMAAPFLAAAVFLLSHLSGPRVTRGRWAGITGALAAGAALTLWGLIAIRMSSSSTAAIAYIFLPFEVVIAMLVGYAGGRVVEKLRPRSTIGSSIS